jgi:hypothetical protein
MRDASLICCGGSTPGVAAIGGATSGRVTRIDFSGREAALEGERDVKAVDAVGDIGTAGRDATLKRTEEVAEQRGPAQRREPSTARGAGSVPSTRRNFRSAATTRRTPIRLSPGSAVSATPMTFARSSPTRQRTSSAQVSPPPLATSSRRWSLNLAQRREPNVELGDVVVCLRSCADVSGTVSLPDDLERGRPVEHVSCTTRPRGSPPQRVVPGLRRRFRRLRG